MLMFFELKLSSFFSVTLSLMTPISEILEWLLLLCFLPSIFVFFGNYPDSMGYFLFSIDLSVVLRICMSQSSNESSAVIK